MEQTTVNEISSATVIRGAKDADSMSVSGIYRMECVGSDGIVKWVEEFDNIVTAQGKRHLLDHSLAGPANAVSTRMALITSGTADADDTYASHTWVEFTNIASRGTPSWSAASGADAVSKATSANVSFSINAGTSVNVTGCAIVLTTAAVTTLGTVSDAAQSGGICYSAGAFTTGGTKVVSSGDTLNVGYTSSLNAG